MRRDLTFNLLGPVRAHRDGRELPLGSPQQVTLLVALLLREGRPVFLEELVRAVWDDEPPRTAATTARTYLSRLRKLFDDGAAHSAIVVDGGGYALPLPPDALDLTAFRRDLARGETALAAGDRASARMLLRQALDRWEGEPLAGVTGRYAEGQRTRLTEMRLAALEVWYAIELGDAGTRVECGTELAALVAQHPLREGFRELLMLAHYRSGRQADALEVYLDGHRRLRDEVGVEPGPRLRQMQQRILAADPALLPAGTLHRAAVPDAASAPVTCLPADIPDFVGRGAELAAITGHLRAAGPVTVGIAGLDGLGRTVTAVRAGHTLATDYPGGQLYADLAAAGADLRDVYTGWMRMLGADVRALPDSAPGRGMVLRAAVTGRRLLAVLDNVTDAGQIIAVRTALPDAGILFTTHRRLADVPGAEWVRLRPLPDDDALTMIGLIAGADRVRAEPDSASRLVGMTCGYPAPLRAIGERLRVRPGCTLDAMAAFMAEELAAPAECEHDDCVDAMRPVRRAFDRLTRHQRQVLHAAGRLGRRSFARHDLAALVDLSGHLVWNALDTLVDAGLLAESPQQAGHYVVDDYIQVHLRRHREPHDTDVLPARRLARRHRTAGARG